MGTVQTPHPLRGLVGAPAPVPHHGLAVVAGASSGIGLAVARRLAEQGFDLVISGGGPELREVVPSLEALGARVEAVQVDLTSAAGIDALYARLVAQERDIDAVVMVAEAGVSGEFLDTSLDEELAAVQLNLVPLLRLTKKVLPDLVKREAGHLIYTWSFAVEGTGPYQSVASASKAFVHAFADAMRLEVAESGVTVTAQRPDPGELLQPLLDEHALLARGPVAPDLGLVLSSR